MLISVVIPVYNSKRYIRYCVDSLLKQTLHDFEILLIDDGSTDGSSEIIDEIQISNSDKVVVVHQDNNGVSSARNKGIELARGEYITFVDSDDWVDENYLQSLSSVSADLVVGGLILEKSERIIVAPQNSHFYLPGDKDLFFKLLMQRLLYGPCQKLYRTSLIHKYDIHFPYGNQYGEDRIFNYLYLEHVNTISTVGEASYHYRISESGSLCSKYVHNLAELQYKQWKSLYQLINKRQLATNTLLSELYRELFFEVILDNILDSKQMKCRKSLTKRYRYIHNLLSLPEVHYLKNYSQNIKCSNWLKDLVLKRRSFALLIYTYLFIR